MSDAEGITQRTALDQARADGKREALSAVLVEIDKLATNSIYERAGKRIAIAITRMLRAVNETITQA